MCVIMVGNGCLCWPIFLNILNKGYDMPSMLVYEAKLHINY